MVGFPFAMLVSGGYINFVATWRFMFFWVVGEMFAAILFMEQILHQVHMENISLFIYLVLYIQNGGCERDFWTINCSSILSNYRGKVKKSWRI